MAWPIAAGIQFPPGFDEGKAYPTIVSVHPFGSCKEQTSGNVYGKALAERGFVVIAYDASFQGESGGSPRWVEDPTQRVEDISRVIDYAVTLPYVDTDRIGAIGVCGGYAVSATLTEKRIKAVVSITGVNIGRLFREGFSAYDPIGALDAMAVQRTKEARGGELQVNELLPASPDAAKANGLTERDVFEATDYYKTPRGRKEGGATRMVFSHAQKTLAWDAFAFAFAETLLTQPLMVVIGQKVGAFGAYRDGLEIYGRATASKDRQLVSLEDWSHYDLYDKPEPVQLALEQLVPFFKKHL